jgi:ATP-dependent RNA helicase DDX27
MIGTIDSDAELSPEHASDDEEVAELNPMNAKISLRKRSIKFGFDDGGLDFNQGEMGHEDILRSDDGSFKDNDNNSDDDGDDESGESDEEKEDDENVKVMPYAESRSKRAAQRHKGEESDGEDSDDGEDSKDEEDDIEEEEKEYFDSIIDSNAVQSSTNDAQIDMFSQFNLSRALLRAINSMGYVSPTEVQSKVIPLAMAGRDVCASALTGSGKTAAFIVPILERLIYRPKDTNVIRVIVLSPSRELASQIYEVTQKLSQFTDITSVLICGGKKDVKSQSIVLQQRPDIVVGTPGRIIDHLRNTQAVSIDQLDILVLDEADRLLEFGFQEEIAEIVKHCPVVRQTMLFSATMTAKVEDLVKLSLKKPVRVKTAGNAKTVAPRLVQEFIRLKKMDEREAIMSSLLCKQKAKVRTIVFFETKREAHRFKLVLSVLDVKAVELHSDLSQVQRNVALQQFRDGVVDILIATDVASRGIDVTGVHCVINSDMPRNTNIYIHRVGRTARAGTSGTSITLVSESRRKTLKSLFKDNPSASNNTLARTIPSTVIADYISKIANAETAIEALIEEEKTNKAIDQAMAEAERAQNIILHEDEIHSRPSRTWYQTESQKRAISQMSSDLARAEVEGEVKNKAVEMEKDDKDGKEKKKYKPADAYERTESKERKRHSETRKKKRRRLALEAMNDGDDSNSDSDSAPKQSNQPKAIKVVNKKTAMKQKEQYEVRDKKLKARAANRAALRDDGKSKKSSKTDLEKNEDDEDDDIGYMLKKKKKISNKQFKSKAKYKRR